MEYQKRSGFTMIEMLIVIGLIAGLMALVLPRLMNYKERAKRKQTESTLNQIKADIMIFEQDFNRAPSAKEGLKVLFETNNDPKWRGPYSTGNQVDGSPVDGWENPIAYNVPPKVNKSFKSFELISFGGENRSEEDSERKDWVISGQ